jgi:hypothetical protein
MTVNFKLLAGNLATIAAGSENDLWPLNQNGAVDYLRATETNNQLQIVPQQALHARNAIIQSLA